MTNNLAVRMLNPVAEDFIGALALYSAQPTTGEGKHLVKWQASLPTKYVGVMQPFRGFKLARGRSNPDRDWVFSNVEDELDMYDDEYPLPPETIEKLRYLERLNINFDEYYIAHEVEGGVDEDNIKEAITVPASRRVKEHAGLLGRIFGGLLSAGARGTEVVWAVGLDPILFGAVKRRDGYLELFVIDAWVWDG